MITPRGDLSSSSPAVKTRWDVFVVIFLRLAGTVGWALLKGLHEVAGVVSRLAVCFAELVDASAVFLAHGTAACWKIAATMLESLTPPVDLSQQALQLDAVTVGRLIRKLQKLQQDSDRRDREEEEKEVEALERYRWEA